MLATSIGVLGWTEDEFWKSDLRTLTAALEVHAKQRDELLRVSWEQVRWQTSVLLAPNNKGRAVDPLKLVKFPWEQQEGEVTKATDYQRVANKLGRKIKK